MSEIDWSKAPEGATHWGPGVYVNWYKKSDKDEWMFFDSGSVAWEEDCNGTRWCEANLIARPVQWRGPQDGLPPVGMEVEGDCRGVRKNCKVVAIVNDVNGEWAIVQFDDDWKVCRTFELLPIQSERDKTIAEIAEVLVQHEREHGQYATVVAAAALYDAGCRMKGGA